MTSLKLAFQNVRRSVRDFTVYFLTLMLGVSIFYVFNSLEGQQTIMNLTSGQSSALTTLNHIMANFSIFISAILGFLIIYANRYLIKRRKQEFGIYMTLGMERGRISRILVLETAFVGLIALVAGSMLGILLSQGMAVATAKLLGAGIANFQFVFSWSALQHTALYFGLTFLLVMIFNVIMIRRQKLIDLIYASRQNEKFKAPKLKVSVVIFLVSLVCLAIAYILVLDNGITMLPYLWGSIILGVTGTFLFFFSLSGFFLQLIQGLKNTYFKGLNMFVLRQLNSKIHTAYISITIVCLMLAASICTLSAGMGLAKAITADVARVTPYDATVSLEARDDEHVSIPGAYPEQGIDLLATAERRDIDLDKFASRYAAIRYYDGDVRSFKLENDTGMTMQAGLYYAKLSDYNRILALQDAPALTLGEGEYAVNTATANEHLIKATAAQIASHTLEVGGETLRTNSDKLFSRGLEVNTVSNYDLVIVVPDQLLDAAPAKRDLLHVQYRDPDVEALAKYSLNGLGAAGLTPQLETKALVVEQNSSAITTVSYLAVYLGVIFLIASATVLAITQLSEANDNARRYRLLQKIGTDSRMINRAIFSQVLIYFGIPLALALVHTVVGITVAAQITDAFQGSSILGSSLVTALILIGIYGGYFLATYIGSKNTVNRGYAHSRED